MMNESIKKWHEFIKNEDIEMLENLLDEHVVFHSPVVHTPQAGKQLTKMYLMAAQHVFSKSGFTYVREVASGNNLVLEFNATIDGITINGIDMIRFNDAGKIIDFKVMIRPLKAVNMMHQKMMEMLAHFSKKS